MEMIDDLADGINTSMTPDLIDEKVASMSCKAAVKGNNRLSAKEVDALIGELLTLDNPYHCPSGRKNKSIYRACKKNRGRNYFGRFYAGI